MGETNREAAIIAFGGCGFNTLNYFQLLDQDQLLFIQVEDDEKILKSSPAEVKIRQEDCESPEKLAAILPSGIRLFFLVGGLGGTSCQSMPQVARVLKERGALGVGLLTSPFDFENRSDKADQDLKVIRGELENICLFPNNAYKKDRNNGKNMAEFMRNQAEGMWMSVEAMTSRRQSPDRYDIADLYNMLNNSNRP